MKDKLSFFSLPGAIIGAVLSIIPLWGITFLLCPGFCDSPVWLGAINLVCGFMLLIGAAVGGIAGRKSLMLSTLSGLLVGVVGIALNFTLGWQLSDFYFERDWGSVESTTNSTDASIASSFAEYWEHPLISTDAYMYGPDNLTTNEIGEIWVETSWHADKSVSYFDGESWQEFSWADSGICPSCTALTSIVSDGQGMVWFASGQEIAGFNGADWHIPTGDRGFANIFVDHEGDLWATGRWFLGDKSGPELSHYDGTKWTTYTYENAPLPDVGLINTITFDRDGRLWAGCSAGLSVLKDGEGILYTEENSELVNDFVEEIHIDAQGRAWLKKANAFENGLQMFDGSKWYTFSQDEFKCNRLAMTSDDSGTFWVGSCDGSVMSYEGDKWTNHTISHNSPKNIRSLIGLIGFLNEQVSGFSTGGYENGTFSIMDIEIDNQGRLWVMSRESLRMFDGESWIMMNEESAGYSWENSGDIAVDANDNVWIFAPERVSVFNDS